MNEESELEYYDEEYLDDEETYEIVGDDDYYDEDFTLSDYVFLFVIVGLILGIIAAVFAMIRATFKKANMKIGKFELGVETVQKQKAKDNATQVQIAEVATKTEDKEESKTDEK